MPFTGKLLQVIAQLYTASCGSCTYCNSACWQYSCAAYAYVRTCWQLIMLCLLLCLSWFIKCFHIANHCRISCLASLSNNAMEWQIVCLLLDVPCVFVEGCATVPQCLCCGRWSLASITRLVMPIVQLVLYVDCDWYMEHPGCSVTQLLPGTMAWGAGLLYSSGQQCGIMPPYRICVMNAPEDSTKLTVFNKLL